LKKENEFMSDMKFFTVTSGYGFNTRQPYVEIQQDNFKVQMSPTDARALALSLLASAEAALGDAFLVEFGTQSIGLELNEAAGLLAQFREWRQGKDVLPGSGPVKKDAEGGDAIA
jgi:hypothetical protein